VVTEEAVCSGANAFHAASPRDVCKPRAGPIGRNLQGRQDQQSGR
jgi:hypothetical protein